MMPLGHLAVGYLVYSVFSRLRYRRSPDGGATLVLALGTQFPDLVDKPLNWWFGVLDGRGAGHSLLVLVPLCVAIYLVGRRYDRSGYEVAFAVGVLSHLVVDSWRALVTGAALDSAPYLFWPLLPAPSYPKDGIVDHLDAWVVSLQSLSWHAPAEVLSNWLILQGVLALFVFFLWWYDGFPGMVRTGRSPVNR